MYNYVIFDNSSIKEGEQRNIGKEFCILVELNQHKPKQTGVTLHDNSCKATKEITRIYEKGIEVVHENIDVFKTYNRGTKE